MKIITMWLTANDVCGECNGPMQLASYSKKINQVLAAPFRKCIGCNSRKSFVRLSTSSEASAAALTEAMLHVPSSSNWMQTPTRRQRAASQHIWCCAWQRKLAAPVMAKGHESCNARVPETPRQTIYRNIFERSRLLSPVVACARFGSGHVEHNALPQSV